MRYLPKMQQLRVFEEVVRQGSIRSAARALAQSQPAVSRALKELENTLQTTLFIRGPSGISLTPSGQLFAVRTRFILQELQRAGEEINAFQQQHAGQLAVGLSGLFSITVLNEVIKKFYQYDPHAQLTLQEGTLPQLLPLLISGDLDFAAGPLPASLPQERLQIMPLFTVPLCVVAAETHPLRHTSNLQALARQKWLQLHDEGHACSPLSPSLQHFFQHLPQPRLRIGSLLSALELVAHSGYLMLLPLPVASHCSPHLNRLPLHSLPGLQYGAVSSKHSPLTASAQQLLRILSDVCGRFHWHTEPTKTAAQPFSGYAEARQQKTVM